MKIIEIYSKYKIPPNLQEHMMRVAGVGNIISSNWKEKGIVDVDRITKALLIHDIANVIIFNFDKFSHLLGEEEKNLAYWKKVQKEFIKKYGKDEHQAVIKIAKELKLEKKAIMILDKMPKINLQNSVSKNEWELKICFYSDFRVAPFGVTSIKERVDDLIKRRKAYGASAEKIKRYESIKQYCFDLEKEIQKEVAINLFSINEEKAQAAADKIKQYSY